MDWKWPSGLSSADLFDIELRNSPFVRQTSLYPFRMSSPCSWLVRSFD